MKYIAILFIVMTAILPLKTEASGYYPPRIQQLCNDNFIGTDWNKSMKYEKRCRVLWTAWSNEMKYTLPY